MHNERVHMQEDPLGFVLNLVLNNRYNTRTYLHDLINNSNVNDLQHETELLKTNIRLSESSRRVVYCRDINPDLTVHNLYLTKSNIFEVHRVAFTRFRVSSHSLAVETGRWNRRGRGRLPMEERLCSCGAVQSEEHVISFCPLSQHIRDEYSFTGITDLMSRNITDEVVCKIIYQVLNLYD